MAIHPLSCCHSTVTRVGDDTAMAIEDAPPSLQSHPRQIGLIEDHKLCKHHHGSEPSMITTNEFFHLHRASFAMTLRNLQRPCVTRNCLMALSMRLRSVCAVVVAIGFQSWFAPSARAQTPSPPEAERCALINLANYYLRCANVHTAMLGLIEDGIKRDPAGAAKEQREAAAVTQSLLTDFISVSVQLYQRAGQQLTPDFATARQRADEKDVDAAVGWYLSRRETIMKALLKGQKAPETTPNPVMDLCTRSKLGQEIREPNKIDARFLVFHQEAKQALSQNKSCLK